jgi:hypothetical protein
MFKVRNRLPFAWRNSIFQEETTPFRQTGSFHCSCNMCRPISFIFRLSGEVLLLFPFSSTNGGRVLLNQNIWSVLVFEYFNPTLTARGLHKFKWLNSTLPWQLMLLLHEILCCLVLALGTLNAADIMRSSHGQYFFCTPSFNSHFLPIEWDADTCILSGNKLSSSEIEDNFC